MVNNATTTLQYINLAQTTQYRAIVQSGVCSILPSTITTITVNPPAVAANAGPDQSLCSAITVTLQGNDPKPFTGYWKQTGGPAVIIVSPANAQTTVTGLASGNVYKFAWAVKGIPPCVDNQDEVVITDLIDIKSSFTADQNNNCGSFTANFTNTSNALSGAFAWDFGDGSQASTINATHTFQTRTDGKDTTYIVSLSVVNNCTVRPAFTLPVTVRPAAPVVSILPDKLSGCAPFTISIKNTSPGNNKNYIFNLYDGVNLVQQIILSDKSNAVFNPVSPTITKTYTVYMIAVDQCGNTAETKHIPLTISPATIVPQMFIQNNSTKGCAPFMATFVNNTSGGLNFFYNIYDLNGKLIDKRSAGTADMPYVFTTPGTYFVSITAMDVCTNIESDKVRVDVSQSPVPQFIADATTGCGTLTVKFTNQTTAGDAEELLTYQYDWDFGDGSPHSFVANPLPHTYVSQKAAYTVTLRATNSVTGCLGVNVMQNYITVNTPPVAAFIVKPDSVINIPDYKFSFYDNTSGSVKAWQWNFGDGKTSALQNPEHTYSDTGRYNVTLAVTSLQGCISTVSHKVRITGVPGELYLPNAFMPNAVNTELRKFMAKGSGIKEWNIQIFNNWGQMIWESHLLGPQGTPVEGWDGTYKGSAVPQGVYMWQATATFINGTAWKGMSYNGSAPMRSGSINLIR
jgi:PKD repeat protein